MKKIIQQKYAWVFFTACFIALVYLANLVSLRADLTAEKRFSLSPSTHQVLEGLDSTVTITVFLTGDLPADYRKLNQAVQDL